ncbi:helix-turn-helix domain-containing protein [Lonepinella sp. BR2271]|uniref:helix-turn-helix domain-containing protein n=1 Tax=Lonepinella sp. BR2271 TaxID=3434550 RepID=UPI003F6E24AF
MNKVPVLEINDPFNGVNGKVIINTLRKGLLLKYADLSMNDSPASDQGLFQAGIRLIITLQGKTQLQFGKQKFVFSADKQPVAVFFPISKDIQGAKYFEANATQKELVMFIESDWLKTSNFAQALDYYYVEQLEKAHLQPHILQVNKQILTLVNDIIERADSSQVCQFLYKESCCLNLLFELLSQLPQFNQGQNISLKAKRTKQLTEFLLSGKMDDWNLTQMAAFLHTNVTTMQRDFKQIHGISVMAYLRQLKLERSYRAILNGKSISEAATVAGYSNPDNFTTAFRKYFNIVPSQVRKQHLSGLIR